ncbi:MAG: low affinity iron permease family protein [Novosphingobium sp.]
MGWFDRLTTGCARFAGRPAMFAGCLLLATLGLFAYLGGNELFVNGANLAISVLTLLLLPVLQATQNRDGAALQAKLDELIKVNSDARDALIGLEQHSEAEIQEMRACEQEDAERSAS